jgi:predicted negative regulator of RcsB-dependent stress response
VESYRTEEEQLEAIKKWWNENGRSTLVAIVLALGAGLGWQEWQDHRQEMTAQASLRYDAMLEAVRTAEASGDAAPLRLLADGLKEDFPGTAYAQFAALHLARLAVVDQDLGIAESELRWVLTRSPEPEIRQLTELRLARVMAAQQRVPEALNIVAGADAGSYASAYAEAEGDFLLQLGDDPGAISAYQRAMALSADSGAGASEALQLKLQTLQPVPARELAALEE